MPECPFCDSENATREQSKPGWLRFRCPQCQECELHETLVALLQEEPDWPRLKLQLAKVVPWAFYTKPVAIIGNVQGVRLAILAWQEFEEEREKHEARGY